MPAGQSVASRLHYDIRVPPPKGPYEVVVMRRIWLAIRVFFAVLFNGDIAARVEEALRVGKPNRPEVPPPKQVSAAETRPEAKKPAAKPALRSEAITLLATLQREARFVDFIKEPLAGYEDAQIGAVARDVHRDCAAVIERLFAPAPVVSQPEGAEMDVPAGFDSGRYQLTGNVVGDPPFHGHLAHHGWEATRCEVPSWSGKDAAARVIAPAEVELR